MGQKNRIIQTIDKFSTDKKTVFNGTQSNIKFLHSVKTYLTMSESVNYFFSSTNLFRNPVFPLFIRQKKTKNMLN